MHDGVSRQQDFHQEHPMKKRLFSSLTILAFMLALTFPAVAPASAAPERHPEIREALAALHRAKDHLEHAAHDFGGHRVEALRATDEAIHQLQACLEYDK
jgi:hypothetical protein